MQASLSSEVLRSRYDVLRARTGAVNARMDSVRFLEDTFSQLSRTPRGWEKVFDENFDGLLHFVYPEGCTDTGRDRVDRFFYDLVHFVYPEGCTGTGCDRVDRFFYDLLEHSLRFFRVEGRRFTTITLGEMVATIRAWIKYGIHPLGPVGQKTPEGHHLDTNFYCACLDSNLYIKGCTDNYFSPKFTLNHYRKLLQLADSKTVYKLVICSEEDFRLYLTKHIRTHFIEGTFVYDLVLEAV